MVLLLDLVRRQKLKEKYAILWMTLGVATLILAIFPRILYWLSELVGIQVPSNLLFAMTLALLVGVSVHLSWELSRSEGRTRRLAEEVAILRTQVELVNRADEGLDAKDERS
nr:DUF2304 domain-containing protein [Pseudoclavibacter sp. 13-3]